jgi:hypothetical protein
MKAEKKPEVIELDRYRKAAEARAAAHEKARVAAAKAPRESMLGGRRHAGLWLILVLVIVAVMSILPRLTGLLK